MKFETPVIRTREDYYLALFGPSKEDEDNEVVERAREDFNKRKDSKDSLENIFHIEEMADRYRLHNLEHNNGIYTVDWSKELLGYGETYDQEEWMRMTESTEFKIPSMPLYHSTIMALFEHQEHHHYEQADLVQKVREMFQHDFKYHFMMTSSRIKYAGKKMLKTPKDTITHDWKTKNARELKGRFVVTQSLIKPGFAEATIEAILGTKDLAMLEEAYEWINEEGRKPYLYRIIIQPKKDEERPLALGVNFFSRLGILAGQLVNIISGPARGVVITKPKQSKEIKEK